MTVEVALVLSFVSVGFGILSTVFSISRNNRKDTQETAEEKAATNTMLITKLENIADDVKDIKRDYRETREEVQNLRDRVVVVEQSLKSYHKRLDGERTKVQ